MIISCCFFSSDVGPITHTVTSGLNNTLVLSQLRQFEAAVNGLTANGGHDYAEYALDAMLAALNYSFVDEFGPFIPMGTNSKMVVITDATSKNPQLEGTVIERARRQGVSIHFILGDYTYSRLQSYTIYSNIAAQAGGIVYTDSHSTWSVINFYLGLSTAGLVGRKKRSAPSLRPTQISFNVSTFASSLRLTTYSTRLEFGTASIMTPRNNTRTVNIEDSVLLYPKH